MLTLITGGAKCGKSRLAEQLLDKCENKIYVATMRPFGEEAEIAIARHRKIRAGKGFATIEKYTDIQGINVSKNSAVLLECIANLCANEMFDNKTVTDPTEQIFVGIKHLKRNSSELVIVTNNVGSDGIKYSSETTKYIEAMGRINAIIAALSDNVIECVYGVPVVLKGKLWQY